jgi:glyoxylate reductase
MLAHRVLITRLILEKGLALLDEAGCVHETAIEDGNRALPREELLERLGDCDALLCHLSDRIDREVLARNPQLLGVANFAVGYNNIDLEAATELGIPVSNTPDVLTEATADLTWALLLAAARHIPAGDRLVREGNFRIWNPVLLLGDDVGRGGSGVPKTLGIVGFGRIGTAVARRARGFDMRVLAFGPRSRDRIEGTAGVRWADFETLLEQSDFLTLHAPLTDDTFHMIGEPQLRRMKPSAYLINVARGPLVDEAALVRALRENWIRGAALDVYEREPQLQEGLADAPNVVLAPHIGSATLDTRSEMAAIAARNTIAHLRGERAPQAVNPDVYQGSAWKRRLEQRS